MSRVLLLAPTTPAQSRQMILLLAGGLMVMDKALVLAGIVETTQCLLEYTPRQAEPAARRVKLLDLTVPVGS